MIRFILTGISKLPFSLLYMLSSTVAFLLQYIVRYRAKVIYRNLKNSFPEKSEAEIKQITKDFYLNLTDVSFESLKLVSISKEELEKRVRITNIDVPMSTLDNGQSHLGLTSHLCNWEWLLQICAVQSKYPIDAVYKPLHNKKMDTFVYNLRARFGAHPVAMKDTLRELIKNRKTVRSMAMVADQTPPHSEIQHWATFLNQYTPFYVGGDKIGGAMQMPVLFVSMKRIKRGYYEVTFEILKNIPIAKEGHEITERYINRLEACIKEQPANWLWSHKRWKHVEAKIVRKGTVV
ncbi:lysophospholipid acyltransferase family protein [Cytophaga hutchinsonii]|uniref:Lauroyl/myristoyl acyltransferase n=1 Tax=Cytophaga hutchinsonii (strain ATCC 33406 / DSM 1761 / CIP 103989 / NBRC 15051 / NCIMB 9469 / D465) TaxID=269798 RepID=A0A6N4SPU2_CYTH3|nr:lysophospholipid acyltransferase family protein [Cytophaga hutchinsonii]ABG58355.1 lauroyl/myristoyl acyltransferase [Cytophaga hutchinsonii ATCC 33406]SFX51923.1 KDO2-lipid IV(A) lauroyltransferase [Cytophaga hutchinsonii ATCC 33406]